MTDKVFSPGEVLTAADVNNYLLNKTGSGNVIINGAFDIWQRGTSFTDPATGAYLADRWTNATGSTGATRVLSQQTFTPNELNAASFGESPFYFRFNQSVAGTGDTFNQISNQIEDVRTLAGQTVTLSFYAKAAATTTVPEVRVFQNFGSGGSATVFTSLVTSLSVSTSWTRYSFTGTLPSISGKTLGASNRIGVQILLPNNATFTFDLWGVQLEAGSVATPFRRNANSLQGELAACQRYYQRINLLAETAFSTVGSGIAFSTTAAFVPINLTPMRRFGISVDFANLLLEDGSGGIALTALTLEANRSNSSVATVSAIVSSGLTQFRPYLLRGDNSNSSFIGISAEL